MKKTLTTILFQLLYLVFIQAQAIPHMGVAVHELTSTEKTYNLFVKDYEGMLAIQYSLSYDPAKMSFREIKSFNTLSGYAGGCCFGNPIEGKITSAWIDNTLEGQDIVDSTAVVQLVFDVIAPGGSTLCFSNAPLGYEFIQQTTADPEELIQMNLHDDCFSGLVLLDPTGIKHVPGKANLQITDAFLTQQGVLQFTTGTNQRLAFTCFNLAGQEIGSVDAREYSAGVNTLRFGAGLLAQGYLVKVQNENGNFQVLKIFAR